MKRLILIGGTMGIGKTAVSQTLKRQLGKAVLLDGDWCWDAVLAGLDTNYCQVTTISLMGREDTLRARLEKDIRHGMRTPEIIERSSAQLPMYQQLNTIKVWTDGKGLGEVCEEIEAHLQQVYMQVNVSHA